jgi:hypothetical protein
MLMARVGKSNQQGAARALRPRRALLHCFDSMLNSTYHKLKTTDQCHAQKALWAMIEM